MSTKKHAYESMIMSWSCFGDFVLIAQTMQTLIDNGIIKKGIIISHQVELKNLLNGHAVQVLYPTKKLRDLTYLILLCCKRNIFVLQDMPSHNRLTRELRLIMSICLTLFPRSKLLFLIDVDIRETFTTSFAKLLASKTLLFDKKTKIHISQYMLDLLHKASITPKINCTYNLLPTITKPKNEYGNRYIVIHPFAGGGGKTPPVTWWQKLVKELHQKHPDYTIVITGSLADKRHALEVIEGIENVVSTCGELTFQETIYLIKGASIMLSVDTGPMHYAALFGVKQVLIWMHQNYTYMPVFNSSTYLINGDSVFHAREVYEKEHTFIGNISMTKVLETTTQHLASGD